MKRFVTLGCVLASLSGCGTLSGLGGTSEFACSAPDGVSCESVSGVYANSLAGTLPSQQRKKDPDGEAESFADKGSAPAYIETQQPILSPKDMAAMDSGLPIRQPPRILRVWVAPWEDDSGDLHDQKYFYTVVNTGTWLIEANKNAIQDRFRPVYPLGRQQENESVKPSSAPSRPLGVPGN